ncbi:MAG: putative zinc-binding protein [Armatimonadetes bacterium]|nr:putative zinc-binding protein [Armatimonadota bacterium]
MGNWIILPCNGIGNPLSTVSRYAAYRAAELLAEAGTPVELVGIGRVLARLAPWVDKVREGPVAVVEGCSFRCATRLLAGLGAKSVACVYIPEVMQSLGLGRRGLDRKYLGPKGRAIVEAVAQTIAGVVAGQLPAQQEPKDDAKRCPCSQAAAAHQVAVQDPTE